MSFKWDSSFTRRALLKSGSLAAGLLLLGRSTPATAESEPGMETANCSGPIPPKDPTQEYRRDLTKRSEKVNAFWDELEAKFNVGRRTWLGTLKPVTAAVKPEAEATNKANIDRNYSKWVYSQSCRDLTLACCEDAGRIASGNAGFWLITKQNYIDAVDEVSKGKGPHTEGVAC